LARNIQTADGTQINADDSFPSPSIPSASIGVNRRFQGFYLCASVSICGSKDYARTALPLFQNDHLKDIDRL